MAVTITEAAATEIKRVMETQSLSEGTMLRIGVSGGGCSGMQYQLDFDDSVEPSKDHIGDQHGVKVAIGKMQALHLDGTTLDFHDGEHRRGFTFDNPNAVRGGGCSGCHG
jgi:iron-sulfur cluster assembly protein